MTTAIVSGVVGLIVAIVSWFGGDRNSKRAERASQRLADADERQAAAAEGNSVASLSMQVIALVERVVNLETEVGTVKQDNALLKAQVTTLEADNSRLRLQFAAALDFVRELVPWVETGAQAPAPAVPDLIAADVALPPSWLHPTTLADPTK